MRTRHITIARRLAMFFVEADGFASVRARARLCDRPACAEPEARLLVSAPVSLSPRPRPAGRRPGISWRPSVRVRRMFVSWSRIHLSPDLVAAAATRKRAPVGPPYTIISDVFSSSELVAGVGGAPVAASESVRDASEQNPSAGISGCARSNALASTARRRKAGGGSPSSALVANEAGPSGGTSGISPSEGGISSCGASAGGGDAMNSDRFISTLRNPIERKIEANCSPAHPVSEVIWPLTTNPFDVPRPPAPSAARAWPSTIAARIMPARRSSDIHTHNAFAARPIPGDAIAFPRYRHIQRKGGPARRCNLGKRGDERARRRPAPEAPKAEGPRSSPRA